MKITEKYVFFYGEHPSQWYPSLMVIDGIEYNTCEQYMMHQKALLFNDVETAKKIMDARHPADQKRLGREVKNFDRNIWDKVNLQIVYKGNYAKYTQNEELKQLLINTGDRLLVEASPYDQIWGIGLGETEPNIDNPLVWKGQNLLGWAITLVKQEILNELKNNNKNA
jgi:ribA/ribD-fused uncharacterized protein